MSKEYFTLDFDEICNRAAHAGMNASVSYHDEEEAYVLSIESDCGDFQIAPGFRWNIEGEERILAHPERLNAYRTDGTEITCDNASDEERSILEYMSAS